LTAEKKKADLHEEGGLLDIPAPGNALVQELSGNVCFSTKSNG